MVRRPPRTAHVPYTTLCRSGPDVDLALGAAPEDVGLAVAAEVGGARDLPIAVQVREDIDRSEEHTSELQSLQYLVCRLLLEQKTLLWNDTQSAYHTRDLIAA